MDARYCVEALNDALARYAAPEIFNTDQGSQLTSFDFTGTLKDAGVSISMDGRGQCLDNVASRPSLRDVIERLRRSLKYEAVYRHELTDGFGRYTRHARPHRQAGGKGGVTSPIGIVTLTFLRQICRPRIVGNIKVSTLFHDTSILPIQSWIC